MTKTSQDGAIAVISIDIGKTTFHLIGLDARGAIVLRQKLRRGQRERRLANVFMNMLANTRSNIETLCGPIGNFHETVRSSVG